MAEKSEAEKKNIFRPLGELETTHFLDYYKDLFLQANPHGSAENADLREKIKNLSHSDNKIDPKCVVKIKNRLVRIEYPGEVRNVEKAIDTLGGMASIETSVADQRKKLELRFHPDNRFSKSCIADRDFKPGILLKVKKSCLQPQPCCSKDKTPQNKFDYQVEGVSVMNFSFNRLCDFQYLPLVVEGTETKESSTESIYHKILPVPIPDQAWFNKNESKDMEPFLLPVRFSHYDTSHVKFNTDPSDKSESEMAVGEATISSSKVALRRQRKICKVFGRSNQQISIFANFKDNEVPLKPLETTVRLVQARSLEEQIAKVKKLFEQRPIWTKAAVLFNTGLQPEHSKIVLPMVAYYFINGPWRISWVKYGYDPREDPKARIYQTLDYRIRTAESAKLKVNPKRSYTSKSSFNLGPSHVKKVSLKDDISSKPRLELDERCYVLRPDTIPPARQMFYQICDLILPEIQDMISRLPRLSDKKTCDSKNGWLPKKFIEDCREIVNNYVLDAVQKELLEDNKVLQEKVSKQAERSKEKPTPMEYCNQMLSNIKKGIYKNVDIRLVGPTGRDIDPDNLGEDVEMINLSDDDDDDDDLTVGDIIQRSIPEKMENDEDDYEDSTSQSSDEGEIDMEAVKEINQMIVESTNSQNT